ncbi:hypothetical protein N8506_01895 [Synechococcus sp. AH-601-N23]|nr:hypothetical protein [Synechococcus sp. AH-601-N23]
MFTYTYNGTNQGESIEVSTLFELNPAYTSFVLNGGEGDDDLYADDEVNTVLNGGNGDDYSVTYGEANTTINGGSGNDEVRIMSINNDVNTRVTGGFGNDSLIIGFDYIPWDVLLENGLMLRQSENPLFTRVDNGTTFSLQDTVSGGTATIFVEDSVEFISFYDELGQGYSYTTEDIASGIIKKEQNGEVVSNIDWWSPTPAPTPTPSPTPIESDDESIGEEIEVPVFRSWSKKLQRISDKDGIIDVHIDENGLFKKKSRHLTTKFENFAQDLLEDVADVTGLEINYVTQQEADILIHSTGNRLSAKSNRNFFDVNFGNKLKGNLNSRDKEDLAPMILYCFGLDDIGKKETHNGDDSLMSYWYAESGYNGLTSADITALQSLW